MADNIRSYHISDLIRQLFFSWLLAVLTEYLLLPGGLRDLAGLEGLAQMSLLRVLTVTAVIFTGLFVLSRFLPTAGAERWGTVGAFGILAAASLLSSFTWAFLGACVLILALLVVYGVYGWDRRPEHTAPPKKAHKVWLWLTLGLALAFFLFVSAWTVARVYVLSTPTYDFGLFCQMFHNMDQTGLPMTTLERDGLLSHFAVHVSPIYYLMLPIYRLLPYPATLQVLQAAVLSSAVIPLWKLGKLHGLSGVQRLLLCALLLLYPAYSGGTSYDLHENCFLTPLILWLLYGIDRKSSLITAVAALLTLMVKEDAAVYVAVIALWLSLRSVLRKKDLRGLLTGLGLLAVSLGWFFAATGYLANRGDGVMTGRYNNFMYDGSSSLLTVIKALVLCPMKGVYECVDPEKLWFIALTALPFLGLPLMTRRYERLLLLFPYILVNLMSDYQYQHDIFFQYTFGSAAFLIYLTLLGLSDLRVDWQRVVALAAAAAVCAVGFGSVVVPTAMHYPVLAIENRDHYRSIRESLDTIPDDASVTASTFYTTWLSRRETLYDLRYCSREHLLETEYVVLRLSASGDFKNYATGGQANGLENLRTLLEEAGYEPVEELGNVLVIYRRH